ncbi:hypothetical protein B4Q13_22300 [Lacticaseibacillus rhamnosus]
MARGASDGNQSRAAGKGAVAPVSRPDFSHPPPIPPQKKTSPAEDMGGFSVVPYAIYAYGQVIRDCIEELEQQLRPREKIRPPMGAGRSRKRCVQA